MAFQTKSQAASGYFLTNGSSRHRVGNSHLQCEKRIVHYHSGSLLGRALNVKDVPSLSRISICSVLNGAMEIGERELTTIKFQPQRELIIFFSSQKFASLDSSALSVRAASPRERSVRVGVVQMFLI